MRSAKSLKSDRARVQQLFKVFAETDDVQEKLRIMDTTLDTLEGHRDRRSDVIYVLHGIGTHRWYEWQRLSGSLMCLIAWLGSPVRFQASAASERSRVAAPRAVLVGADSGAVRPPGERAANATAS